MEKFLGWNGVKMLEESYTLIIDNGKPTEEQITGRENLKGRMEELKKQYNESEEESPHFEIQIIDNATNKIIKTECVENER